MEEQLARESADLDPKFYGELQNLSIWALRASANAEIRALEWLAAGALMCTLYFCFVVLPTPASANYFDAGVLLVTLGTTLLIVHFEFSSAKTLKRLGCMELYKPTMQSKQNGSVG